MVIRAVLDTCVLYPFHLRDFLLTAAGESFALFDPIWSQEILKELVKHHPDPQKVDKLINAMSRGFPKANITLTNEDLRKTKILLLPDKDDAHVVAAAITAKASLIVTNNLKDFPKVELSKVGVEAIHSREFVQRLATRFGNQVLKDIIQTISKRYKNPKRTPQAIADSLKDEFLISVFGSKDFQNF